MISARYNNYRQSFKKVTYPIKVLGTSSVRRTPSGFLSSEVIKRWVGDNGLSSLLNVLKRPLYADHNTGLFDQPTEVRNRQAVGYRDARSLKSCISNLTLYATPPKAMACLKSCHDCLGWCNHSHTCCQQPATTGIQYQQQQQPFLSF